KPRSPRQQHLVRVCDRQLIKQPAHLVDGNRRQRMLVYVHSNHDHWIASYRGGRPASGQASLEAAAKLLSGHARRSREGGGDTTLESQPSGDVRGSWPTYVTRTLACVAALFGLSAPASRRSRAVPTGRAPERQESFN